MTEEKRRRVRIPRTTVRRPRVPTPDDIARSPGPLLSGLGALGAGAVSSVSAMLPGRAAHDRWAGENLWDLGVDRGGIVAAGDGVPLAVRESGPADAPLTVVFVHGYCLSMDTWHFQRGALTERFGDRVRMVFYDQRGHGASGPTTAEHATIDQLSRDLSSVVEATTPSGPVVLVGHSMGGMTVMAYAARHAEAVAERIVGVGLVSTAASKLSELGLGAVLDNAATLHVADLAERTPSFFHGGRRMMARFITPFIYGGSFGNPARTSPTVARFVEKLIASTDVETIAAFVDTLTRHDETAGLSVLREVRTTILCGTRDLLTPLVRSEELSAELPDAEFTVVPGAGHMVMLEAPSTVNSALIRLVEDALEIVERGRSTPSPKKAGQVRSASASSSNGKASNGKQAKGGRR